MSKNIDIEHVFQSKAFFHLTSNLRTSCFSAFKGFIDKQTSQNSSGQWVTYIRSRQMLYVLLVSGKVLSLL